MDFSDWWVKWVFEHDLASATFQEVARAAWAASRMPPPDVSGSIVVGVHYERGDDDGPP